MQDHGPHLERGQIAVSIAETHQDAIQGSVCKSLGSEQMRACTRAYGECVNVHSTQFV